MRADYKISTINETREKIIVVARLYKGDFQDIEDPETGEVVNTYVRTELLDEKEMEFPLGTSEAAILETLNGELDKTPYEPIDEQK